MDLGDGLDPASTAELQALYGCLNQSGDFDALEELVDAMDAPAVDGATNWSHASGLLRRLPEADLDPRGLLSAALELLRTDSALLTEALQVLVELIYGRPYGTVTASVALSEPAELDQGVLPPLLDPLGDAGAAVLADGDAVPLLLADVLRAEATGDALCTLVGIARSDDAQVQALAAAAMTDLGEAIARTREPANDRWAGASGDSLRDLAGALLWSTDDAGETWLDASRDSLGAVFADERLRDRLEGALVDLHAGGHVAPLFLQLRYMAEVDARGTSLDDAPTEPPPGERVSALSSFLRLLDAGSRPVTCGVIGLEVDDLAVTLLGWLATLDPATIEAGVSVLGELLDSWLGGATLDLVVATCDGVTEEMAWDLRSIDRFNDEQTGDLLVVLLEVLAAFREPDGDLDRTPELVDLLGGAWRAGLLPPTEELLRDVGNTALASDLAAVIPLVVDPSPLAVAECPTGTAPLDFAGMWTIAGNALAGEAGADPALDVALPAVEALVAHDGTWAAVGNLGALLRRDGALLRGSPDLGARLLAVDPELELLEDAASLLEDPSLVDPALQVAASPAVTAALAETSVDREGPLPWVARLVVGGTLKSALHTVDLVLDWLDGLAVEEEER